MPSATNNTLPPLVFLIGPTATGKSALALSLAPLFHAEIVSADSRLLYRGMDIGTAKPTPDEQASVPHHLIDVTNPDQPWSLSEYLASARQLFADISARQHLPLLVGGTGQYIRALQEGWRMPSVLPDPTLRDALEQRAKKDGGDALFQELISRDPDASAFIDPRNVRRVIRALEVVRTTGQPFSAQRARDPLPYRLMILGLRLPREELYARADARIDAMLRAGWIEEVRGLLALGYAPTLPAFSALGYGEIIRHLRGDFSFAECVQAIRFATHRFIRHQDAWFRNENLSIGWMDAQEAVAETAITILRDWLEGKSDEE
jgi:tRNA dimethylallyltransferase